MRLVAMMLSNGAASIVGLLLTIVIGRQDGPSQLGVFGVAFAAMLMTQLFVEEIGINRALSNPTDREERQVAYSRSLLVAMMVGAVLAGAGLVLLNPIVIAAGAALPGYVAFTFLRLLTMTDGQVTRGFWADGLLVGTVVTTSICCVVLDTAAFPVVIAWAVILPVSAWLLQSKLGLQPRPRWASGKSRYTGLSFGIQNLFGAGSVHIATFMLASFFGSVLVGAIRGAATLLGPVNLLTTSINTITIRQLAVGAPEARKKLLLRWFSLATGLSLIGASLTWLLAHHFGQLLLAASWDVIEPLVPWIALDAVLVACLIAAKAAHRVDSRGDAAWKVNVLAGLTRLVLLPLGGLWAGAVGVAMASALTTFVTGVAWWISYAAYRRVPTPRPAQLTELA